MTDSLDIVNSASARLAAGALFFDDNGAVLLVKPAYKQGWEIPGGHVEPGESPRAACQRDIAQELGISASLGDLLVVDWAPHPAGGDMLLFVFHGGALDPTTVTLGGEIGQAAYHRPDQLTGALSDRLARSIAAAMTSHDLGLTLYLEHGRPVPAIDRQVNAAAGKHRA